jgi:anti-sigma factor RsiW
MKLDCRQFLDRLDDFLEGKLAEEERVAVREHARRCERCREASMIGSDLAGHAEVAPPAGLAEAILEQTSGPPCESARERLCDHVDGLLDGVDEELVSGHVSGCEDCGTLAAVLVRLSADLPALTEVPPDDSVVRAILDRTAPGAAVPSRRATHAADWAARTIDSWKRLLRRPRLAWEGAYVGTVFLLLLFGLPLSPLSGVTGKVVTLLQGEGVSRLEESIAGVDEQLSAGIRIAWDASGSRAIEACREVPGGVDRLSGNVREAIAERLGTKAGPPASMSANEENERPVTDGNRPEGEER